MKKLIVILLSLGMIGQFSFVKTEKVLAAEDQNLDQGILLNETQQNVEEVDNLNPSSVGDEAVENTLPEVKNVGPEPILPIIKEIGDSKPDFTEKPKNSVINQGGLRAQNGIPNSPTDLTQKKIDDTTNISVDGWTNETSVIFSATVSDPDSDQVRLCVETKPINISFDNSDDCGDLVVSDGTASATIGPQAANTEYHWQARTKDENDNSSSRVPFGGNNENERDYGIDIIAPQIFSAKTSYPNKIDLTFSEAMNSSFNDLTKIIIPGGIYNISEAVINSDLISGYLLLSSNLPGDAEPKIEFAEGAFIDLAGNPNEKIIITAVDGIDPSTPLNFYVVAGSGYVDMSWSPVGDAVAYEIWRASSPFGDKAYCEVDASTTTFRDYGVTNGKTYYYQIRARDAAGNLSPLLPMDQSLSAIPFIIIAPEGLPTVFVSSVAPAISSSKVEKEIVKEKPAKEGEVKGKETKEEKSPTNWPLIIGIILASLVMIFWLYYWYVSFRETKKTKEVKKILTRTRRKK